MQPPRLVQPVAQLAEIARAAAPGDQPAERPADVGQGAQLPPQPVAQARIAFEQGDEIEPRLDPRPVEQGRAEIGGEQPRAGAGDGAVDRVRAGCRRVCREAETVSSRLSRVAASIII